jgi:hypothetical protein
MNFIVLGRALVWGSSVEESKTHEDLVDPLYVVH